MVVGAELKEAAAEAGLGTPGEKLDARRRTVVAELKAKPTATFDRAYIETQYMAHVEAVALFQAYAGGGSNIRMKQFARDKLPILQSHLKHVSGLR
jgi:putative membrane protein